MSLRGRLPYGMLILYQMGQFIAGSANTQATSNILPDTITSITNVAGFMMILPSDFDHSPLGGFLHKLVLFVPFCILPRVLDNKGSSGVPLAVCFPTCSCTTRGARCPSHQFYKNKAFSPAISFDVHDSLTTFLRDRGIKPTQSTPLIQMKARTLDMNWSLPH